MAVKIQAVYQGNLSCEATHVPSAATLQTDAPTDNGGEGKTFSPTDLVATALGTCVLTILGLVAQRHDLDIGGGSVEVVKEMASQPVRRIASLKTIVQLPAAAVPETYRERLEEAARKCPVHKSLHPEIDAPIEFVYT